MRAKALLVAVAAAATWSLPASAQDAAGSRGLELVYLNAEVGGAYVNIGQQFTNQGGQGGAAVGVGAGLRFVYFTVGLRGRIAPLSAFTLYEGNLELGIHVPAGAWDPYLNIHGGYAHASMNAEEYSVIVLGTVVALGQETPPSPSGGDVGGSLGTDYYFSSLFSLGLDVTLDALILSTGATTILSSGNQSVQLAGQSNTGIAFIGAVHAGLHFDL
jgi:hypothetical protein